MRVAAIYDIHGNLPALEAVLQEIRQIGVDQIVVGGDVIPGPMPRKTLRRLLGLEVPMHFLQGNGESAVLAETAGTVDSPLPASLQEVMRWTAQQLSADDEQVLVSWPQSIGIEIDGIGKVLFCHATPRNNTEIFTERTATERLFPIFAELEVALVICGHTHIQFDRMIGNTRVVNAGSVGMPFGKPGADWLLLGPELQFQHTTYDLAEAAERIRATAYPQAEAFATQNVLQPPSAEEMLDVLGHSELQ